MKLWIMKRDLSDDDYKKYKEEKDHNKKERNNTIIRTGEVLCKVICICITLFVVYGIIINSFHVGKSTPEDLGQKRDAGSTDASTLNVAESDIDQGTYGSVRMVSPSGTVFEAHPDIVNELKSKGYEQVSEVQNDIKQQQSDSDKTDKYIKQFSDQDNFGAVATQKFLDFKLASTQNVHGREFVDPQAIEQGVKSGEISQEDADKLQSGNAETWMGALSDTGKYADIPKTTRLLLLKGNVPESDYRVAANAIDKIQSGHPVAEETLIPLH
jgi:hypothetical protein